MPTSTARDTMLWPMFNSSTPANGGHGLDVGVIEAVPHVDVQPSCRASFGRLAQRLHLAAALLAAVRASE